jgi:hypothetical protein
MEKPKQNLRREAKTSRVIELLKREGGVTLKEEPKR